MLQSIKDKSEQILEKIRNNIDEMDYLRLKSYVDLFFNFATNFAIK